MITSEVKLHLTVAEVDVDDEGLEKLTSSLLNDLRELGAESVERYRDTAPPEGAKGDPFTLGALVLVVVPVFLPKLIEFLQVWTLRGEGRTVRIKTPAGLEVEFSPEKKLSNAELLTLVEKFTQISQ